jgi:hypothetical protein
MKLSNQATFQESVVRHLFLCDNKAVTGVVIKKYLHLHLQSPTHDNRDQLNLTSGHARSSWEKVPATRSTEKSFVKIMGAHP